MKVTTQTMNINHDNKCKIVEVLNSIQEAELIKGFTIKSEGPNARIHVLCSDDCLPMVIEYDIDYRNRDLHFTKLDNAFHNNLYAMIKEEINL